MTTGSDLTIGEAATALNVSKKTVYREIIAGRLAAFWVGGQLRVSMLEIESYRERRRVVPPRPA